MSRLLDMLQRSQTVPIQPADSGLLCDCKQEPKRFKIDKDIAQLPLAEVNESTERLIRDVAMQLNRAHDTLVFRALELATGCCAQTPDDIIAMKDAGHDIVLESRADDPGLTLCLDGKPLLWIGAAEFGHSPDGVHHYSLPHKFYDYDVKKAPCLNGGPHSFGDWRTCSPRQQNRFCIHCDAVEKKNRSLMDTHRVDFAKLNHGQ